MCLDERVRLRGPPESIEEFTRVIRTKPYLRDHISQQRLNEFLDRLTATAEIPDFLSEYPQFTSDPNDAYLVAHALLHQVDYLVTGDVALLALHQVHTLRIVEPAEFLNFLEAET
jgi:predicted nucleic acid-binding protein